MKTTAVEYYNFLGDNRQQIAQTQRSRTIEDIINALGGSKTEIPEQLLAAA